MVGNAAGNLRKRDVDDLRLDRERRGRHAEQRRNRVFHQRALSEGLRRLRACGVELRLRLRDVEAGCDAGIVALLGELERARIGLDGLIEDRAVAIEAAQLNVIIDQLRDQRQARILEIRGGRGGVGLARGDLVANLPPQVELVADAAAERCCHCSSVGVVGPISGALTDSRSRATPAFKPSVGNSPARA